MSDDAGHVEPPDGRDKLRDLLHLDDAELGRTMRQAMLDEERKQAETTTDEHGDPFPRLYLDDRRPKTDDPLLRVGYALLAHLPEHWKFAMLSVTAAADEIRTMVLVKVRAGKPPSFESLFYLPDVGEACSTLRRSTYEADGRAWYNAHIRLERNGIMKPLYDFDQPPFGYWGPREVDLALRDQELYPRDPEQLPAWHPAR